MLVSYFYEDMSPPLKQLLETMCGGDFMNKNLDESFQFLDYVAEVSRSWEEPIVNEPPRDRTMNKARASGMYNLPEGLDVQAKFVTIMRRLDDLETRGIQEIQIVNEGIAQLCLICKSMEHGVQFCPALVVVQDMFSKQVNALGTYKQYSRNSLYSSTCNPGWRNHPNLSWREAMHKHKVGNKTLEILEVLKQVKINIPFLDMIKQVPTYAKFLKDLCIMKRRMKLSKKAFISEQVSAIFENKAMVKYKDLGHPSISVQIGDSFVEKALLDLGTNVNLIPYSIYNQLGLGELKATTITFSLVDHSIKVPKEVVEDVLVQVERFYYSMDFVLSFRNMIMEMNVFNLCKQLMDHDDIEDKEA
ncbi:hypothetical protein CK203_117756 [Vitis vinifera]|uniref:Aspartic peptidase DDI1-type domain-containing protein n=1 Tax=Vitis vinifera TaxID=29760 RepID=A0A438DKX9_VITVI|nr:hypothetical protein CK203_117756 [Vitis vinifera]